MVSSTRTLTSVTDAELKLKPPLCETRKAYLAGMIDGEGCIHCTINQRSYYLVHISLSMKQDTVPRMLQEDFGGSVAQTHQGKVWTWQLGAAKKVRACLETLLPYLLIKRRHATIGIALLKTIGPQGQHILSISDLVLRSRLGQVLKQLNEGVTNVETTIV